MHKTLLTLLLLAGLARAEGVTKTIQFEPGAYSATVKGAVVRGDRDNYLITASKGQKIWVRVTSLESNAVVQLYSPGEETPLADPDASTIEGKLRWSGTYRIEVGPSRGNATYQLKVTIR